MKTTYMKPAISIVMVEESEDMLAGSNILSADGTDIDFSPSTMEEGDGDDAFSRSYDSWDE